MGHDFQRRLSKGDVAQELEERFIDEEVRLPPLLFAKDSFSKDHPTYKENGVFYVRTLLHAKKRVFSLHIHGPPY